ncbi:helix-turn-helix transcriptional regulator [Mycobacterium genavense]|uniref:helix-turn-helix transcriptional regulator n=1 Tax=Mycobacterium genavense TaxID=36812 RepID=UPI00055A659C|nr:helix-turn-helix domain-containing protein [Mycobacterium genavense]
MTPGVTSTAESAGRRREVLRILRTSREPMTIVAIADVLGVHPNTVRFHLDSLAADDQVEQVEPGRKGPGRPPLMFRAVRQMDRGGTRHYRLLAEILTTAFAADQDAADKALAAGRSWGRQLVAGSSADATNPDEAIGHLIDVLDRLGFAPERRVADGEHQVGLRHCPFLEVAENRTAVVCPVHLGIMQGALETSGAPVAVERLDAFVEPDLCVAHLELQEA